MLYIIIVGIVFIVPFHVSLILHSEFVLLLQSEIQYFAFKKTIYLPFLITPIFCHSCYL